MCFGGSNTTTSNQNTTQNQTGNEASTSVVNPNAIPALNAAGTTFSNEEQNGLSQATLGAANAQGIQANQTNLNSILNTLGGTTNGGALATQLGQQATEGEADLQSQLAGQNQTFQQQGAVLGANNAMTEFPATNVAASNESGTSNTQGTTTQTSTPSFGDLLGSLIGIGATAFTGGAAGAGGIGSILSKI